MSVKYVKDYKENSSKLLYSKRLLYKVAMREPEYENLFDFSFAEKQLYGRVTRVFEPMTLGSESNLKALQPNGEVIIHRALPFVVDAFNKLNQQFAKKTMRNEIDTQDQNLSTLTVYKAYENPQKLYNDHLKTYKDTLAKSFRNRPEPVSNFNEFMALLIPALKKTAYKNPFTMTAYVKSTFCPITVSGLAIEIADLPYVNDEEKIASFKNSKNWHFYLNACRTYGFMVDTNVPWRIIADIGSAQMIEYAKKYELYSTDEILNGLYLKVAPRYFKQLKGALYELYNACKKPRYEKSTCLDGTTRIRKIPPTTYTFEAFKSTYTDQFFLETYFTLRFAEEESRFTALEQKTLIDDAIDLCSRNLIYGINVFERILNKTFDYNGSLEYITNKRKELESNDNRVFSGS